MNTDSEHTEQVSDETKAQIDAMSQYEMCRLWRFAEFGNPLLQGATGDYFRDNLFKVKGGFTPAISKSLGWE